MSSPEAAPAQTVTAALGLVDAISGRDGQSLSELARTSGFSLNRTFRLLSALEDAGYVARDPAKGYHLGPRLMLLGQRAATRDPLVQAAGPVLDWLSAETGEAVALAMRVGLTRSVVAHRESRHALQFRMDTTDRIRLHWGALGLCLLAFSPEGVQRAVLKGPFEAYSAQTITDPSVLAAHLQAVRRAGHDIALEPQQGVYSVAAPILGRDGFAVAALNIAGPLTRLDETTQRRYVGLVCDAARRISDRLEG
jgi:IclR family KDG regulon transcriptional repressor